MTELFEHQKTGVRFLSDRKGSGGLIKWEIRAITAALLKIAPVSTLYGDTKDRAGEIEAFVKGDTRFFVAHPATAAHGLNLQHGCSTEVFFSLSYSMEQYEQARGRIHRAGQKDACTFVHLVARDTIDAEILDVVRGKRTAQELLLGMISGRQRVAA